MEMRSLLNRHTLSRLSWKKKIAIAVGLGLVVFCINWWHMNSDHSFEVEDKLFYRETSINELLNRKPKKNDSTVFSNTGQDLSLVDNISGFGNIEVTDRSKLLKFLTIVKNADPRYVVLDLQFYIPYSSN